MIGRAAVLAVFCASIYFDVWSMIKTPSNVDVLSIAFFIAFLSADEPWIKYIHKTEKKMTVREEQS